MKKIKNYWDELKNENYHYHVGNRGWNIEYKLDKDRSKPAMIFCIPFSTGDGVPRLEKSQVMTELRFLHFRRKMLAKASENKEAYIDLYNRAYEINEKEFRDMASQFKGFKLGEYIRSNYLTERESHALFWNM